jgi:hypothetical protein
LSRSFNRFKIWCITSGIKTNAAIIKRNSQHVRSGTRCEWNCSTRTTNASNQCKSVFKNCNYWC